MKTIAALLIGLLLAGQTFLLAGDQPEYLQSFDPAKGFKPAQRDLTEIFLQLAGSLEFYGSPEPYLRHMQKEHSRIEALFLKKVGNAPKSYRPSYLTDRYIDRVAANWNALSPQLGLGPFAKEVGEDMREAIKGTRGTGTMVVEIFNKHQTRVFNRMAGKQTGSADFDELKSQLIFNLELDKKVVDEGKYEVSRRDAVSYAIIIHGLTTKLFQRLDQGLKAEDAERVKTVLTSVLMDVGQMAHSELEVGLAEWAADPSLTAAN